MLAYDTQLELKRKVVEKAYTNFSGLPMEVIPSILPTLPSPKTYGYRTKITPHFDVPAHARGKGKDKEGTVTASKGNTFELTIGFAEKGRRRVIDIEECVIATPILNEALGPARENVKRNIHTYKRGATLLLRDSLKEATGHSQTQTQRSGLTGSEPFPTSMSGVEPSVAPEIQTTPSLESFVSSAHQGQVHKEERQHICITDHKATVREQVGESIFEFPAGSFFQNNNSVLLSLVRYVRDAIFAADPATTTPTHLVDTYCGSGLFAISLASAFQHIAGVEISADSITSARHNAKLNGLPPADAPSNIKTESITFSVGKSESIFETVSHFPSAQTVVIIDPPRKGCDQPFLEQLVRFRPAKLVYVSCNVHTQARDIGDLVRMMAEAGKQVGEHERTYTIESLRGLDLFPQTSHVESVAVLRLANVE